jgi:hypothetical protein
VRIAASGFEMNKNMRVQIFLLLFLAMPAAHAQQKGLVEGRVVNATDPSIVVRSVELDIVELDAGMRILKTVVTDSSGRFRVDGLPESGRLMLRVNYKDVNYHRQFSLGTGGKATADLEVYEPTTSMKDIEVGETRMAFQMTGGQLISLEAVTFNNKAKPPRTYMNPEGNFLFSKPPGISEPPELRIIAPGSTMPLVQAPLESPDGQRYYSLYPLKPGSTSFEVQQALPYANRTYAYTKTFYRDIASMGIGVTPSDMVLSGQGLTRVSTDAQRNFSVYRSAPIKAGTEVTWTFSGGTAVSAPQSAEGSGGPPIEAKPDVIRRNAPVLGPLLLLCFVLVLWYAFNRGPKETKKSAGQLARGLKERREQLLKEVAELDRRHEMNAIGRQEYLQLRAESKRQLRRISLLLKM